jgi:hypothetical protein
MSAHINASGFEVHFPPLARVTMRPAPSVSKGYTGVDRGEEVFVAQTRPTWRMAAPFVVVALLSLGSALLPPYDGAGWEVEAMLLTSLASLVVLTIAIRRDEHSWVDPLPAYLSYLAIGLARDVSGGATSGLGPLVLLPVLWLAVTGSRHELAVGSVLTATLFVGPMLLAGPPTYPLSDWRQALLWTSLAGAVGPVVHELVQRLSLAEARWRVLIDHVPTPLS